MRAAQRLGRVVVAHRHRGLQHDRTGVELAGHEMDGRAGDLHAVLERLALRVDAGERRQQRRVDVEDRVREGVEQRRADEPHEAGEADQRTPRARSSLATRAIEGVARRERAVIEDQRLDARPRARARARRRRRGSR